MRGNARLLQGLGSLDALPCSRDPDQHAVAADPQRLKLLLGRLAPAHQPICMDNNIKPGEETHSCSCKYAVQFDSVH